MINSRPILFSLSMLIVVLCGPLKAQQIAQTTPLHLFFQTNFDSTIIYHSSSSWNASPSYLIIAKQEERIYFFTYVSPYRNAQGVYYPGKLITKFSRNEQHFRSTLPDTNRYFLPKLILPSTLLRSWRLLQPHRFWTVQDDRNGKKDIGKCVVDDGEENTFYLIDKKAIRAASFYEPDYFEECLGKDLGRQQAITARTLLRALQQNTDAR